MKFKTQGRKHYYVYQGGKKVGTLTHKHNELTVNNNGGPILIRTNPILREILYYVILIGISIPIAIYGFPALVLVFLFGSFILDPMDLSMKINFYIPKPTGTMELTSDKNYKTNATVIVQKRTQFLHIRFTSLQLCFLTMLVALFYMAFKNGLNAVVLGLAIGYAVVYVFLVWFSIKKYIKTINICKLEKEEQQKVIDELV